MILQCGRKRIKKPSLPAENVGKKSGRGPMGATIAIETSLPSRRSKEGVSKMGREEIELSRKWGANKSKPRHTPTIDLVTRKCDIGPLLIWLSKKRNWCHFNCATFHLPLARSLCCLSKEFASKKKKKFLDGQPTILIAAIVTYWSINWSVFYYNNSQFDQSCQSNLLH